MVARKKYEVERDCVKMGVLGHVLMLMEMVL